MDILIVSIDHQTQRVPHQHNTAHQLAQKAQLREILRNAIANGTDLICEESDPARLTVAQKMAYENNPVIPWKNIIMTAQERLEAGIYQALADRPYDLEFLDDGAAVQIDHRIPENDIREDFFRDQILEAANAHGAQSILILCGDMHVDALKTKLEVRGHHIETNRDLIQEKHWQ